MDLTNAMAAFVRAAERGGFSAAARDLGITQPHVTRAVQQLEDRLGARLFNRTTRRLALTDEGLDYLDRCRSILSAIDDADQSIGRRAQTLSGHLRIFAPVSLGRALLLPRIADFLARHPALDIDLILDDQPRDLIEERLDLGLRVGPLPPSTLRARRLGAADRFVVATPGYWAGRGRPGRPEALEAHESLIFDGAITLDRVAMTCAGESVSVPLRGRLRTNSSEAILAATRLGLGVCVAPDWLVGEDLAASRLERVLDEWRVVPSLPIFVTYPETRAPTEKVRRFVDWLVVRLQDDGLLRAAGEAAPADRLERDPA